MNGSFSLKTLDKLRFCLKNVESTVNNMLLFAKGKEDRFESMAAIHFMKKLSGDLIHSFPQVAIRVNVDQQIDQATLQINYTSVLNSIKNLMLNAAQVSKQPKVSIRASVCELNFRLHIQDNGPGIPSELADQVFDPFFSTRKNGTGLGLAIVRSTIEAHQGNVAVVDSDVGAAFVIDLPLGGAQTRIGEQDFAELKNEVSV